jgi:hypothetical protein
MKPTREEIYKKVLKVSQTVEKDFRTRGIVIPTQNNDGTVSVGSYMIVKNGNGYYFIKDRTNEIVVDQINLPQTAALLANSLALGRFADSKLIAEDKNYGYALFEEQLHKQALSRSKNRDIDYFHITMTKFIISQTKKNVHKQSIVNSFEKLRKLA